MSEIHKITFIASEKGKVLERILDFSHRADRGDIAVPHVVDQSVPMNLDIKKLRGIDLSAALRPVDKEIGFIAALETLQNTAEALGKRIIRQRLQNIIKGTDRISFYGKLRHVRDKDDDGFLVDLADFFLRQSYHPC